MQHWGDSMCTSKHIVPTCAKKNVKCDFFKWQKVHLDDLDVYLDNLICTFFSDHQHWNLQRSLTQLVFNLKQEVFIRRDEERPEEGWYLWGNGLDTCFDQRWTVKVNLHTFIGGWLICDQCHVWSVEGCCN